MTQQNILSALRSAKPALEKKYPIKALALFGSFGRNKNSESSDIDVMVEFNEASVSLILQTNWKNYYSTKSISFRVKESNLNTSKR